MTVVRSRRPPEARRPRVLHVGKFYHPYRGGMETHLRLLCQELRRWVDVEVVVANTDRRTSRERIDDVDVTRLGTLATVSSAPVAPGLARRIRASVADIVHVHLPHPTAILSYLASGHKGPLVVTYHSDIVRQKVLGMAFEPVLHRFLDRAAAIICTSPNYIESSRVLRGHRDRCHVLPFSIGLDAFRHTPDESVAAIRARFGTPLVLGVGRLIYYKGFEYLIEAMRDVPANLVIIGDGPLRLSLEKAARRNGVSERVALVGEVADAVPYFHAADLFALPSIARSEAFGLVQLEAMACGKPVVNTALASGVPYVSIHGETGLTVPPADAAALARAIRSLLVDPEWRAELGQNARRRVESCFTLDDMAARTVDLYSRVLGTELDRRPPITQHADAVEAM